MDEYLSTIVHNLLDVMLTRTRAKNIVVNKYREYKSDI